MKYSRIVELCGVLIAVFALTFDVAWNFFVERPLVREETLNRAFSTLATPLVGNSGKAEALLFLQDEGRDLAGLDLSCDAMGGNWNPTSSFCLRPPYLQFADREDKQDLYLDRSIFDGVRFTGALDHLTIEDSSFVGAIFDISVESADVNLGDFSVSHWSHDAIWSGATIIASSFDDALFDGPDFFNVDFGDTSFDDATFQFVEFTEVSFFVSDMRNAELSGAYFHDSDFVGVDISGAAFCEETCAFFDEEVTFHLLYARRSNLPVLTGADGETVPEALISSITYCDNQVVPEPTGGDDDDFFPNGPEGTLIELREDDGICTLKFIAG